MADSFSDAEWDKINRHIDEHGLEKYGAPANEDGTVVLGSWNLRKFGALSKHKARRNAKTLKIIADFAACCDFLAVQEVMAKLDLVKWLADSLNDRKGKAADGGERFGMVYSDLTGRDPSESGMGERFAFLFDKGIFQHGPLVTDITVDRSAIRQKLQRAIAHVTDEQARRQFGPLSSEAIADKPLPFELVLDAAFFDFLRSPHAVGFTVKGADGAAPYDFTFVNAHVMFGELRRQREIEFFALIEWLLLAGEKGWFPDSTAIILLADLNLDFDETNAARRYAIADYVTSINRLRNPRFRVNFPFLDVHTTRGKIETNARGGQTYDHIAFFSSDDRLPSGSHNNEANAKNPNGWDYGAFDFVTLIRDALGMGASESFPYDKVIDTISDHKPIWVRLPLPSPGQSRYAHGQSPVPGPAAANS